jgi:carbonic anhydrase
MWSAVTRRDGAAFLHNAAGFVGEHRRHAQRWDLAAIARDLNGTVALYVGGSDEDPYEHRQIPATRERVPQAEVLTFPGGHLTTSEHPDLLAAAIRDIAARHGVGNRTTMTRMKPLLERNEQFARTYTPLSLGLPAAQMLVVTCLDHRVDPAIVLGLQLGDAPVIRNAGGRVTQAVIDDIAFLAFLAEQLFGRQGPADTLFEVAVVHHTQCGTGFLADPDFRRQAAEATGVPEATLEASAVADPRLTVKTDVERLLASPLLSPKVSVSGHVYDIATGRVTTTLDARYP